ncbi:MAG: FAD-dependent oxidoreductase [Bacillota bacterium]|nr:FAD-dependent oxidoreductase [Bacillota bacterium]
MFEKMFEPIQIRGLTLNNRVVYSAAGTKFSGRQGSFVTEQLIHYHVARVKGGSGLNCVEVSSVHTPSAPRRFLSISEDMYIPGHKKLVDAIHEAGGKACIQLWQGGLAVGSDQTAQILVASDLPVSPEITLPGITMGQIQEIVSCFGKAAKRAVEAGYDCVEFHCAHNYLPHSFLSGAFNHRSDEYGGCLENRAKFPLECIREIRKNIPEDMPLFMRIDAQDDYLENGMTIEDTITFCNWAKEAGVDVLNVSRGNFSSAAIKYEVPSIDTPQGFNIDNAARIRKETGMITIGVGRINTPEIAQKALAEDKVDMVVMCRAQYADPEFLNKVRDNRLDEITYCIGCDQGCYDGFENMDIEHVTCLLNPALGREKECAIVKTDTPETVLIAGGGIAGLEAALTLKRRGHNPILMEASDSLGGQFVLAGKAPRKKEMSDAVERMAKLAEKMGVDIRLNTLVTPETIASVKPHTLINAIGATPIQLNIPGNDLDFVYNSHEVLAGDKVVSGNVVVIGGGLVGCEVAEYVAEKGCKVTILEMLPQIASDLGSVRKTCVMESIYGAGITPVTDIKVQAIENGKVLGVKGDESLSFDCDYAIVAVGSKSRDTKALEQACYDNGVAYFCVGDAYGTRRALNAVKEAFDVALTFDKPEVRKDALKPKKTVFLTGATGTMGEETMKQLLARSSRFNTRILARDSKKNRDLLKKYRNPSLEIIWGDMSDYNTILKCVTGADYVLHIGAMVSPMADDFPKETLYTNIGSTLNIIKAIKAQPDPDKVHFAYVGTVAMTGHRAYPVHFGRVGDPICPSIFDYYAMSKVFSEMALYDSGLKYWVSIRQTGQHPSNAAAGSLPIITHQPPNNVLEWSTSIESGICMANLCEDWVPESFWRKAYNLSSGEKYRLTTWELMDINLDTFDIHLKDLFDLNRIAKYNFHGQYYSDSKDLDDILHFRCIDGDLYWEGVREEMRRMKRNPMIAAMFPTAEQMKANNAMIGHKRMGTHWMIENNEEDWIKAFFGSKEQLDAIGDWDSFELFHPSEEVTLLDHGYDESKSLEELTIEDLKGIAAFRGGECLATEIKDIYTPIKWKSYEGYEFDLSINAVVQGGHWCPQLFKSEWTYGKQATYNPFLGQVWWPIHPRTDNYTIPMEYSGYDIYMELKEKMGL